MQSLLSWLLNASLATSHLGPRSARGQLVIVQSLVADRQQEAEERKEEWKLAPNTVWKAIFEIQLPGMNGKQRGNPAITGLRVAWVLDSVHADTC